MKNKLSVLLVLFGLLLVGTACSLGGLTGGSDESDEKAGSKTEKTENGSDSSSDSSSSSSSTGEKVLNSGIQECDDLAQYIEDNSEELKDANIIVRGIIYVYKNKILQEIEKGAKDMDEEQKSNLKEVCAKSLKQLKESQEK